MLYISKEKNKKNKQNQKKNSALVTLRLTPPQPVKRFLVNSSRKG